MKVLGITSATDIIGAGIAGDEGILAECSVSSKVAQSEKLIALIDDLLNKAKISTKDIDAVSVTVGPGSYSGLRGGLSTAKGLVAALNIPIISVSTLHAIAFNLSDIEGAIAVAVNACRDDYNLALFGASSGKLRRLTEDITVKLDKLKEVFSSISGRIILACDGKLRKEIINENVSFAEPKNVLPWAVNVARIGLEKLKNMESEDYISLSPNYSHKPNIREYKK